MFYCKSPDKKEIKTGQKDGSVLRSTFCSCRRASLAPSMQIRQLIIFYNSNLRDCNTLVWPWVSGIFIRITQKVFRNNKYFVKQLSILKELSFHGIKQMGVSNMILTPDKQKHKFYSCVTGQIATLTSYCIIDAS